MRVIHHDRVFERQLKKLSQELQERIGERLLPARHRHTSSALRGVDSISPSATLSQRAARVS